MGAFYFNQNQQGVENISILKPNNILYQNYPNPFNPETTIVFNLTAEDAENAELVIYNLKGQKVKTLVNEVLPAGEHSVVWDGKNTNNKAVASGIYFYNLKVGNKSLATKKCLLLK
jgi:flagellar hook assembly protein FlgD